MKKNLLKDLLRLPRGKVKLVLLISCCFSRQLLYRLKARLWALLCETSSLDKNHEHFCALGFPQSQFLLQVLRWNSKRELIGKCWYRTNIIKSVFLKISQTKTRIRTSSNILFCALLHNHDVDWRYYVFVFFQD